MIGNEYLDELYNNVDEDTSLNQILELIKSKDKNFIQSLEKPIDLDICNPEELKFIIKVSAIVDYFFQINGIDVPEWLRDSRLKFDKPYYHSKRISDFDKIKLMYSSPAPFSIRNVYFDLSGLIRV